MTHTHKFRFGYIKVEPEQDDSKIRPEIYNALKEALTAAIIKALSDGMADVHVTDIEGTIKLTGPRK